LRSIAQAIVDSDSQVIVVAELSNMAPDCPQLVGALGQLDENLVAIDAALLADATLAADAGYLSAENIATTAAHGLDAHVATGRQKHSDPPPLSPRGRISKDATPRQRMARKLKTKKGRAVYARRKVIVEPVFGQMQNRPARQAAAVARRGRRPRAVAVSLRRPQPLEVPPGRRTRADHGDVGARSGPRRPERSRMRFHTASARPRAHRDATIQAWPPRPRPPSSISHP
jgi:Transposase DDE domain